MEMALNTVQQTESDQQNIIKQFLHAGWAGDVEALYKLIRNHRGVLDEIDSTPFLETPLHKAAAEGHVSFAVEIMTLKPSLSRKLNEDGLTPLHLALEEIYEADLNSPLQQFQTEANQALQQTQSDTSPALQQTQSIPTHDLRANLCSMVLCLLEFDKDLARLKGKESQTPFHYAAKIGDPELLIEILIICPESILDLTANGESSLQIALKYEKHKAFFMLYNWIYLTPSNKAFWGRYKLQHWRSTANEEISKIERGLSTENYREIAGLLCRDPTVESSVLQFTEETRNALLVVVALLITINFQVLLTPPGGTWQDNANSHLVGTATMGSSKFNFLNNLNYGSLLFSVITSIFLLPKSPASLFCIFPLGFLVAFFGISRNIQDPTPERQSPTAFFIPYALLVIVYSIIVWLRDHIYSRRKRVYYLCRLHCLRWRWWPLLTSIKLPCS